MHLDKKHISNMYKIKRFYSLMYGPVIGEHGNLMRGHYIRVFQQNSSKSKVRFFNNIDDFILYVTNRNAGYFNTYYTLSTIKNTKNGQFENLNTRTVLGFDFDKKDFPKGFNHKDVMDTFKSIGIWYHAVIDSGNGYHVYVYIKPTTNLLKVEMVTKTIAKNLGADMKATSPTQILRVPSTLNIKDPSNIKPVNLIHFHEKNIWRYDINLLSKKIANNSKNN